MMNYPHEWFKRALAEHFAIGAFNTSNLEVTQAIVGAANESRSPVIVQTSEGAIEYAGLEALAGIVKNVAEQGAVPVILHLDHGKSFALAKQCIEAGYTSVMIDGSKESLEDNIRITKEVVEYAHTKGVWVEAELGAIMGKEGALKIGGSQTPDDMLTKPEEAAQFVKETGVDALAVSVGTIHGVFKGQEYIRFELLEEIAAAVPTTPLVLHGASGISDGDLQKAIQCNVCKVNVDTDLRIAWDTAVREFEQKNTDNVDPREMLGAARAAVRVAVLKKLAVFGSAGKTNK